MKNWIVFFCCAALCCVLIFLTPIVYVLDQVGFDFYPKGKAK